MDLFDRDPAGPGAAPVDTSIDAAEHVRPQVSPLREKCLTVLSRGGFTADEIAERLGESILTIRPRVTELNKLCKIKDTGVRRPNSSGRNAIVWCHAG